MEQTHIITNRWATHRCTQAHTHLNYRFIHSVTAEHVQRLTLKEIKSPWGMGQPISPPVKILQFPLLSITFSSGYLGLCDAERHQRENLARRPCVDEASPAIIPHPLCKRSPLLLAHAHKLPHHILSSLFHRVRCLVLIGESAFIPVCAQKLSYHWLSSMRESVNSLIRASFLHRNTKPIWHNPEKHQLT